MTDSPLDPETAHLLYLALHGARETVCRLETQALAGPLTVDTSDVSTTVARIDHLGSLLVPDAWSNDADTYRREEFARLGLPPIPGDEEPPLVVEPAVEEGGGGGADWTSVRIVADLCPTGDQPEGGEWRCLGEDVDGVDECSPVRRVHRSGSCGWLVPSPQDRLEASATDEPEVLRTPLRAPYRPEYDLARLGEDLAAVYPGTPERIARAFGVPTRLVAGPDQRAGVEEVDPSPFPSIDLVPLSARWAWQAAYLRARTWRAVDRTRPGIPHALAHALLPVSDAAGQWLHERTEPEVPSWPNRARNLAARLAAVVQDLDPRIGAGCGPACTEAHTYGWPCLLTPPQGLHLPEAEPVDKGDPWVAPRPVTRSGEDHQ